MAKQKKGQADNSFLPPEILKQSYQELQSSLKKLQSLQNQEMSAHSIHQAEEEIRQIQGLFYPFRIQFKEDIFNIFQQLLEYWQKDPAHFKKDIFTEILDLLRIISREIGNWLNKQEISGVDSELHIEIDELVSRIYKQAQADLKNCILLQSGREDRIPDNPPEACNQLLLLFREIERRLNHHIKLGNSKISLLENTELLDLLGKSKKRCEILDDLDLKSRINDFSLELEKQEDISGAFEQKDLNFYLERAASISESIKKFCLRLSDDKINPDELKLGKILIEMGLLDNSQLEKALSQQGKKLGELLLAQNMVSKEDLEKALERQQQIKKEHHIETEEQIKINTSKMDSLFNLINELSSMQNLLSADYGIKGDELIRFKRTGRNFLKIIRELQEISMDMRLVTLEGLFQKMQRLVRDLSRKFNKSLKIELNGQDTEIDRSLTSILEEVLLHLVRNAVDHGIEDTAQRRQSGKNEQGLIKLKALYEGNEIWITVQDDGKGLDRAKVLAKAKERSLYEGDGKELSDQAVWNFLLQPGFSTKEEISDVSGRGVGLDVVNSHVKDLRGKLLISSIKGEGTSFTLQLPLSLSTVEGITVRIAKNYFTIPLLDIQEFYQADKKAITKAAEGESFLRLRNHMVPIIDLHAFFKTGNTKTSYADCTHVIVQNSGSIVSFPVDAIAGYHPFIVKPLPEWLGNKKGISGCSQLNDKEIHFIIDVRGIISEILG